MKDESKVCSSYENKIHYICNEEYKFFFSKPNVVAVGYGNKVKDGFKTKKECIKVFVENKVCKNQLLSNEIVPVRYKGIETDVVESGRFINYGLTKRIRPVLGGYSIGALKLGSSGSMACMVKDSNGYYILSCNHILAIYNTMPIGTDILQPSIKDSGISPRDTVANLYKYVPLKFDDNLNQNGNYVDCAIAKVYDLSLVSNKIAILGSIKGIVMPSLDLPVRKVAKTTGVTYGYITALHVTIKFRTRTTQTLTYKDQIKTTAMAEGGDSGGILMDMNNSVVGMIVGGVEKGVTTATPIGNILNSLNVEIVY